MVLDTYIALSLEKLLSDVFFDTGKHTFHGGRSQFSLYISNASLLALAARPSAAGDMMSEHLSP